MRRHPRGPTRPGPLLPYPTLFRSATPPTAFRPRRASARPTAGDVGAMSRRLWLHGASGTWVRPARRDVGRGYVPDGFRPRSFPAAWDVGGVVPTYSGSTIDTHSPPPPRLSRAVRPPRASAISPPTRTE